ncbi:MULTISPECIES: hypothetical protein [Peribacillus]|uniref:hypothetical protein n=1 Tax=Peribacillus TaxID=2675229 RepID=UPI0033056475
MEISGYSLAPILGASIVRNRSFQLRVMLYNWPQLLPAFLVAMFTRCLLGTVMIGVLSLMILRLFF